MTAHPRTLAKFLLLMSITATWGKLASAMDAFEIQVYDAAINAMGLDSLEVHLNSVLNGNEQGTYRGQLPSEHLTHTTFELARGLTPYWELGAYLQAALDETSIGRYAGAKLRSKLVVPKSQSGEFDLGVNFEISDVPPEFEQQRWGSEIRPIVGWRPGRWRLMFNPILDMSLQRGSDSTPDFNPALKVQWDTQSGYGVGVEYYADFGTVNRWRAPDQAEQYVLVAGDLLNGPVELNVGVGGGLTAASNSTVAKAIVGFEF